MDSKKTVRVVSEWRDGRYLVRVSLLEYSGRVYCDVRKFYFDPDRQWLPSPKGISILVSSVRPLFRAVRAILRERRQ